ncbi:hypothetical protein E1180_03335 [Roseibium denhamense]|nr:hypothetical protein [Roseibium denhamense]MTI04550.1 hypothetical protein [Roseibium denhamense]
MSAISSILCIAAAVGIYSAMPYPVVPSGAIRPVSQPPVMVIDMIGFFIGLVFFPLAILGMTLSTGALALAALFCLVPACFSLVLFSISVRQLTSWVRFFNNGFEFTQFSLRVRVTYEELSGVKIRTWQAPGLAAWFQATIGSLGRRKATLLNGSETTKTMVFVRNDGVTFTISSELIPDLQRVLIAMDRAGLELPDGISEYQRKKIRQRRERMYGGPPKPPVHEEQLQVARIAALIEHARRNPNG